MLPVGFGWSAGDIAIAIRVLVKVGKAFKSAGGAAEQYNEAVAYLKSLRATLDHLARYAQTKNDDFYAESIAKQLDSIEQPWRAFATFLARFETSLGIDSDRSVAQKAPRTIQYALKDLSGEIDKLKLAISHPLQVVNIMLTLQGTQNDALKRDHATGKQGSHESLLQDMYTAPLSNALQAQLDRMQSAHEAQFAQLADAVKQLSLANGMVRPPVQPETFHANRSLETLGDSAYGTDVPSVFSMDDGSVFTADSDLSSLYERANPKARPVPATMPTPERPRLGIFGYRCLNDAEKDVFFVAGRVFLTRTMSSRVPSKYNSSPRGAAAQDGVGVNRLLVIHRGENESLCAVVCHRTKDMPMYTTGLQPYEIPLCSNSPIHHGQASTGDALSLEMESSSNPQSLQMPPHAFVKLRTSCIIQHSAKVMDVGRLAEDDSLLIAELWQDANPGHPLVV